MKHYLDKNVYEATQERLKFIFENFDNVYVSFSGGKDSGLLLNLVLDYKRKHNIRKKIGVFHQDFEAQYQMTTDFVYRMFENNIRDIEPFWVCLPLHLPHLCDSPALRFPLRNGRPALSVHPLFRDLNLPFL